MNTKKIYRIVHINHNHKSGSFFTLQSKDLKVKSYSDVKNIQEELEEMFYDGSYSVSVIGDAYTKFFKLNMSAS